MQLQAPQFWEAKSALTILLWPLSLLYKIIISLRKLGFKLGVFSSKRLPVPVVIVGNLRVGGTGKTPCVMAIAKALYWKGFTPGVITRGYRSSLSKHATKEVVMTDTSRDVGDEALLMAEQLRPFSIPVWIGADRYQSGSDILKQYPSINVIISDDGLQHYKLARHCSRNGGHDVEIVVSDARGNGNGLLLPAGPLREATHRERDVSLMTEILSTPETPQHNSLEPNTFVIPCRLLSAYQLASPKNTQELSQMLGQKILAVAGIAAPEKFFKPLRDLGLQVKTLALEDHADYSAMDFKNYPKDQVDVILMTEKDAVKCRHLDDERIWVVPLEATLPNEMLDIICEVLHR